MATISSEKELINKKCDENQQLQIALINTEEKLFRLEKEFTKLKEDCLFILKQPMSEEL